MEILYIILGMILVVLFFLNIRNAADILCRVVGGFGFLILYNMLAPTLSLASIGLNFASSVTAGMLGLPGGVLLLCLSLFL